VELLEVILLLTMLFGNLQNILNGLLTVQNFYLVWMIFLLI